MTNKFLFQNNVLAIVSINQLHKTTQARLAKKYPWAKWAVKSTGSVIYSLSADRPTAEAALNALVNLKVNTSGEPAETPYQKAIRTGVKPAIWPPITMTQDDLNHFRQTHGTA